MTIVIGLTGYAGSGKDFTARVLIEKYGFERIAFADGIKDVLYELNPYVATNEHFLTPLAQIVDAEGWDVAKQKPDVRQMLQRLGVAARTYIGANIWVDAVFNKMETGKKYVITDVRFPNEAEAIMKKDGDIWRIVRPGVGAINDHISEHALDGHPSIDLTLVNDSNLEALTLLVDEAVKNVL